MATTTKAKVKGRAKGKAEKTTVIDINKREQVASTPKKETQLMNSAWNTVILKLLCCLHNRKTILLVPMRAAVDRFAQSLSVEGSRQKKSPLRPCSAEKTLPKPTPRSLSHGRYIRGFWDL
jgi:hypothetical protein